MGKTAKERLLVARSADSWPQRLMRKLMTTRPSKLIILGVVAALCVSGMATYTAITQTPEQTDRVFWLLNIDLALSLIFAVLVARQITRLWAQRKRGVAGSQLHVRLVFIFGLLTAAPAILMMIFSALFFYFGVQGWFSERVSTAVNESLVVAEAYLTEHQQTMRADVLAMANDLNRAAFELYDNPSAMERFVQTQSQLRNLSEAIVFTSSGQVVARSRLAFALEFDPISEAMLNQAREGDVVLLVSDQPQAQDRVRALVKLDQYVDTFLLVGRLVDSKVINHLTHAREAVAGYTELEGRRSSFQVLVMLVFVVVALLLVLLAIWLGLVFAGQLARPITDLISASERVRRGDLSARVKTSNDMDEIGQLGQSFNNMTTQLETQREELIQANRVIDERRRFMEVVLASTSSGIVGIDNNGRITLANPMATKLLGYKTNSLVGHDIQEISQDMAGLAFSDAPAEVTHELEYKTPKGVPRIFSLRMTRDMEDTVNSNIIVTFDDISPLLSAQRKAAWSDVARRIAHEIKNPLTPIQLSAERLHRKYLPQIEQDSVTFEKCIETIVRQVEQIGRMVSEFSDFSRMPEAVKAPTRIDDLIEAAVLLQQQAHPDIAFSFDAPDGDVTAICDAGQITQVLNNLLQNAVDAILEGGAAPTNGAVDLTLTKSEKSAIITVVDNGPGLPAADIARLTEPYVTKRKKGTGLGLAIVKKILDDHNGSLEMQNRDPERGAKITIRFEL